VTGLSNGPPTRSRWQRTNAVGTGAASVRDNRRKPREAPGAPTIGTARPATSQATVTFAARAPMRKRDHRLHRGLESGGGVDVNAGTMALSHVVSGPDEGTSKPFTVMALNEAVPAGSLPSNSVVRSARRD